MEDAGFGIHRKRLYGSQDSQLHRQRVAWFWSHKPVSTPYCSIYCFWKCSKIDNIGCKRKEAGGGGIYTPRADSTSIHGNASVLYEPLWLLIPIMNLLDDIFVQRTRPAGLICPLGPCFNIEDRHATIFHVSCAIYFGKRREVVLKSGSEEDSGIYAQVQV
jgi:hypothetical protein